MNVENNPNKKVKPLNSYKKINNMNFTGNSIIKILKNLIFISTICGYLSPVFSNPLFLPSFSQFGSSQIPMSGLPQTNPMMSSQFAAPLMGQQISPFANPQMTSIMPQAMPQMMGQQINPFASPQMTPMIPQTIPQMMGNYFNQPNPFPMMNQQPYSQPQSNPASELQKILETINGGYGKIKNSDDLFKLLKQTKSPSSEEILQAKTKLKYVLSKIGIFDAIVSHSRLDEANAKSSEIYLEGYLGALDDLSSKIDSVKSSQLTSFNIQHNIPDVKSGNKMSYPYGMGYPLLPSSQNNPNPANPFQRISMIPQNADESKNKIPRYGKEKEHSHYFSENDEDVNEEKRGSSLKHKRRYGKEQEHKHKSHGSKHHKLKHHSRHHHQHHPRHHRRHH